MTDKALVPDADLSFTNAAASAQALRAVTARNNLLPNGEKKIRRVDPTTTYEKEYSYDELEFMTALQQYKDRTGRMFPSNSEILTVLRSLGYMKVGMSA